MAGTWAFIAGAGDDGSITNVSAANELPVDWTNEGALPTTAAVLLADGASVTQGAVGDTAVTNPAGSASEIAALKGLLTLRATANAALADIAASTAGWTFSVAISPNPAPTGQVSVVYAGLNTHFHKGKPPRVFTLHTGTLPIGLTLGSSTGAITGTPLQNGSFTGLSIRCTDNNGHTADTSPFTIVITL